MRQPRSVSKLWRRRRSLPAIRALLSRRRRCVGLPLQAHPKHLLLVQPLPLRPRENRRVRHIWCNFIAWCCIKKTSKYTTQYISIILKVHTWDTWRIREFDPLQKKENLSVYHIYNYLYHLYHLSICLSIYLSNINIYIYVCVYLSISIDTYLSTNLHAYLFQISRNIYIESLYYIYAILFCFAASCISSRVWRYGINSGFPCCRSRTRSVSLRRSRFKRCHAVKGGSCLAKPRLYWRLSFVIIQHFLHHPTLQLQIYNLKSYWSPWMEFIWTISWAGIACCRCDRRRREGLGTAWAGLMQRPNPKQVWAIPIIWKCFP